MSSASPAALQRPELSKRASELSRRASSSWDLGGCSFRLGRRPSFHSSQFVPESAVEAFDQAADYPSIAVAQQAEEGRRLLLPQRIIMVRHGESEGNVDETTYQEKGDNLVELTDKGSEEALAAGRKIKEILDGEPVIVFVSPFQRTYQTLRNIRSHFEDSIVRTEICPLIREQEYGNLQSEEMAKYKEEKKKVGRFWYRFPTGESGADVYMRAELFWKDVIALNTRGGKPPVDNVLVVTHGLTMRLLLMCLNHWSPDTFETVFNPGNCDMWVLKKDLCMDAELPYRLDDTEGSLPRSSRMVKVIFKGGREQRLELKDYISIPPPRTSRLDIVKRMVAEQHGFSASEIVGVDLFVEKKFAKYK